MTTPKPYEDGMKIFKDLLDQAETLVNQMKSPGGLPAPKPDSKTLPEPTPKK